MGSLKPAALGPSELELLRLMARQVAVVQYPSLTRSTVRHVELLSLAPARLMLVLITDTGRVEQRMVDCPAPFGETSLADLRARLNSRVAGRRFTDVPRLVEDLPEAFDVEMKKRRPDHEGGQRDHTDEPHAGVTHPDSRVTRPGPAPGPAARSRTAMRRGA